MIKVIGLTGFAGCGKSTIAHYLCEHHGFVRVRFADPLKGAAKEMGLTHEQVDGTLKETPCSLLRDKTPRWFMQWFGTDVIRDQIDKDFWVNAWKLRVQAAPVGTPIVADDVRFPNEVETIFKLGGYLVRVSRPDNTLNVGKHESEAHIDSFICDAHIINDGSIRDLERKAFWRLIVGDATPDNPYLWKQAA